MVTMRHLFSTIILVVLIELTHSQVAFESLCSSEVGVSGMSAVDGNDEFEIDLYETKFLPEDTIYCKKVFLENQFSELVFDSGYQTETTNLCDQRVRFKCL